MIDQNHITLLNEPQTPTRLGTSTSRDTSPDLSLLAGSLDVSWTNTGTSLGSDHDVIHLLVKGNNYKAHVGSAHITNWDQFRKTRMSRERNTGLSYDDWTKEIMADVNTHTQVVTTTYKIPYVDPKLLHLWDARHSLTRRWKRQRHNRKLRKKIAEINKQAADYAATLCKENWLKLCDGLQGSLSTRKTWHLLRHLIDPLKSKGESNRNMVRTLNAYPGTKDELLKDLERKYLQTERNFDPPSYTGKPNTELDKPIQLHELKAAIAESRRSSAPGPDQVTYKLLANLEDQALESLVEYFNNFWSTGKIPTQWKTAEIRFIPKPGKSPHIENLRPISLTSCIGKVMERVILKRLQKYLDETRQMPDTMFGFRRHLGTQDVLIQLKEEILVPATRHSPRAILALDLKGAFDNVAHEAILRNLNNIGCGRERTTTSSIFYLSAKP